MDTEAVYFDFTEILKAQITAVVSFSIKTLYSYVATIFKNYMISYVSSYS